MHALSDACERNKEPILRILTTALASSTAVLEIGSGTGQHATHFAAHLPHLSWQPSDRSEYLPGLREWVARAARPNLRMPIELDVRTLPWAAPPFDALFTANTLHIMGWGAVQDFFRGVGDALPVQGTICIYGPFRYRGCYTSTSNADFDRYLQARDPQSGIRDFESVDALATAEGLVLLADHALPANNQLLVWRRGSSAHA